MNVKTSKKRAIMRKERDILVFDLGAPLTASVVRKTIEKVRKERERQILGKDWIAKHKSK
jgi:hypothetical protein